MNIKDIYLDSEEYFPVDFKKSIIYIHHTSGSNRPDYVIQGWDQDHIQNGQAQVLVMVIHLGMVLLLDVFQNHNGHGIWVQKIQMECLIKFQ